MIKTNHKGFRDHKWHEKIIVLSPPVNLKNEKERVEQLMGAGLAFFHVRKPGFSKYKTERYLAHYPTEMRKNMILHHHYGLTQAYGLKGIHITEKTKGQGHEAAYSHSHVSISCHNLQEVATLPQSYSYAFLSPVMDSISKQGYRAAFEKETLKAFFREHQDIPPVIALGGIHPDTIGRIRGLGFSGVALLGAIWSELAHQRNTKSTLENYHNALKMIQGL